MGDGGLRGSVSRGSGDSSMISSSSSYSGVAAQESRRSSFSSRFPFFFLCSTNLGLFSLPYEGGFSAPVFARLGVSPDRCWPSPRFLGVLLVLSGVGDGWYDAVLGGL